MMAGLTNQSDQMKLMWAQYTSLHERMLCLKSTSAHKRTEVNGTVDAKNIKLFRNSRSSVSSDNCSEPLTCIIGLFIYLYNLYFSVSENQSDVTPRHVMLKSDVIRFVAHMCVSVSVVWPFTMLNGRSLPVMSYSSPFCRKTEHWIKLHVSVYRTTSYQAICVHQYCSWFA
jgi:hypothetical protein